jgi:predicted ArsR family transcriptional regulator
MNKHSNRNIPVERWPESLQILRHLATQSAPLSIRDVANELGVPEISTRNRLARLETQGTVKAARAVATLGPGKQVTCLHYTITQFGRDCAGVREALKDSSKAPCATSVFDWASH